MYRLEELEVWKLSRSFKQKIKELTLQFPKIEEYRLKEQIIRSSRSISANIAEGFGRFHHSENIQYCRHARGSLFETLDHLYEAFDNGYIDEGKHKEIVQEIDKCLLVLNGYISYLKRAKLEQKT